MTVYYVDYTNGADTPPATNAAWGTKTAALTIDSSADSTHFVDAALTGIDDYINGAFFYNRTTAHADIVADFDAASDTVTLTTGDASMQAGDDYYFVFAWKTMTKIGATPAAGDICYVRAGTTEVLTASVSFTNDGEYNTPIQVIGTGTGILTDGTAATNIELTDGSALEIWHDTSTDRPIINCNSATYYVSINADYYISLTNLDIRNTTATTQGNLYIGGSIGTTINNCYIFNSQYSTGRGITVVSGSNGTRILNTWIVQNDGYNLYFDLTGRTAFVKGCIIDGGSGVDQTTSGIWLDAEGTVYLVDCKIGVNTQHLTRGIYLYSRCNYVYAKNCLFGDSTIVEFYASAYEKDGGFWSENHNQIFGNHFVYKFSGTIEKVTDVVRDGGASSSAKMLPMNQYIAMDDGHLTLTGNIGFADSICEPDFTVWCPAEETTITVYVRGLNWATFPTASQLYLEAEYITDDTTQAITTGNIKSTQVLTDNTTWTALSVTFTPHVASFVYLTLHLGVYEDATTGIYVDIKPVVS